MQESGSEGTLTRIIDADDFQAVADVQAAGYERIVAVGYCRGGSMITHLLSKGNESPLAAACIFHPGFEAKRWPLFTKPSFWLLSEQE